MATEAQKLAGTIGMATPFGDGLVARAGGGQAAATQIPNVLCGVYRVTTVATAGDSVVLPAPPVGSSADITIINKGAASMNVFPQVGGTVNGGAANAAYAIAAGKTANFFSVGTDWHPILSA